MAEIRWDDEGPLSPPAPGVKWDAAPAAPVAGASPAPEQSFLRRMLVPQNTPAQNTILGMGSRALGFSPETQEAAGDFEKNLQAGLAMPWSKVTGPLGVGIRALQGAGLGAVEGVRKGESASEIGGRALGGGIMPPVGDAAAKAGRYVFSAVPHKLFSGKSAAEIGDWLRANVPAWAEMKGPRALYDMARESGQARLSDAYEKALTAAAKSIPAGTEVIVPAALASRAGFAGAKNVVDPNGMVQVDAAKLLSLLPTFTKDQATRKAVLDALHTGLPKGTVPDAAFKEYATGSGWMDYAKKSGLFKQGEGYDATVAQKGLREVGKETLERRGMGPVRDIIRGPLSAPPIKKESMDKPAAAVGGLLGLLGGGAGGGLLGPMGAVGGGGMGAGAGAFLGGQLGKKVPVYKNVPETIPQIGQLRKAILQALTQSVIQSQRSTGE